MQIGKKTTIVWQKILINCNYLVGTRYSGFGTRNLDILCLKSSKTPIIAFRIPNSQSRLSNYDKLIY
jgi:hypothetical protein